MGINLKVFKVKKNMKYSLKQYAVYSVLACYTDKKQTSHISREVLSSLSGVSDLDTISKYTKQFELDGLLKKSYTYSSINGKKLVEYKIIPPNKDYLLITNELFDGNSELIGFLCLFAQYKLYNSNIIKLTPTELIKRMGIGRTTFYKYLKLALKEGCITKIENGYKLSEEIFPIVSKEYLSEENKSILNEILSNNDPNSRLYKQAIYFKENGLDLIPSANKVFEDMLDGFWGIK